MATPTRPTTAAAMANLLPPCRPTSASLTALSSMTRRTSRGPVAAVAGAAANGSSCMGMVWGGADMGAGIGRADPGGSVPGGRVPGTLPMPGPPIGAGAGGAKGSDGGRIERPGWPIGGAPKGAGTSAGRGIPGPIEPGMGTGAGMPDMPAGAPMGRLPWGGRPSRALRSLMSRAFLGCSDIGGDDLRHAGGDGPFGGPM
jgi:hypothetical protein